MQIPFSYMKKEEHVRYKHPFFRTNRTGIWKSRSQWWGTDGASLPPSTLPILTGMPVSFHSRALLAFTLNPSKRARLTKLYLCNFRKLLETLQQTIVSRSPSSRFLYLFSKSQNHYRVFTRGSFIQFFIYLTGFRNHKTNCCKECQSYKKWFHACQGLWFNLDADNSLTDTYTAGTPMWDTQVLCHFLV